MLRTEVVVSKNIRKTLFYKLFNVISILVFIAILLMVTNVFSPESSIGQYIREHYNDVIRPGVLIIAFIIFVTSTITRSMTKNPKRLGSLEMDENEIRFLVDDELQKTHSVEALESIEFEFYSFRMRGNPSGCMNYLKLVDANGETSYEITIANSMVKAELGDILSKINQKKPVKVSYAYFVKRLLKDSDFEFK